jgi:hypothetical protein
MGYGLWAIGYRLSALLLAIGYELWAESYDPWAVGLSR